MTINEFIKKYRKLSNFPCFTRSFIPHIVCNDGFKMSVQAGQSMYSTPRVEANEYEDAEVGFPSEEEKLLTTYAEDQDNLCGTVYGYVPCSVIDQVIDKHGGIDESKSKVFAS